MYSVERLKRARGTATAEQRVSPNHAVSSRPNTMTQLSCALPANRSILRHLARIALQTRQFASSSDNKARGAPAAPPPTPTTASLRGILSHSPPPFVASYTPRDLLLYNLAIGAGAEDVESDLELTWEASPGGKFRVVPTWTTCPAYRARAHLSESFKEVFGSVGYIELRWTSLMKRSIRTS